ncbi:MAG: 16S rRNA (uracil(1498)-N(3))-methyltransferase [Frankiaceae bacterium]|nr:16S rRNA (uracil(1498)-N(3))-methyltransferase [Frankiaceae bacterium]MBV9870692.1 16S rRNA (uracil(1498)-N(3))-methyltransferase [Frankiaceae bacterium]
MTAPVFFATVGDTAAGDQIVLDGPEGHHAADVRRLFAGEAIDLTDGAGVMLHGVVAEARRGELTVDVTERVVQPAPTPWFTVVQALAKGGRDEDAVEAMTEVGVDQVVGWTASRSIAKWTDRTEPKWTATVQAAAKQSRRAWWPTVAGPASTADVAGRCEAASLAVVLHEAAAVPLASLSVPSHGEVVLVVGPEGGISDEELAAFTAAGAAAVRLGQTVLRSSTAGVAALSVLSAHSRWR